MNDPIRSALIVDFDNVFVSLRQTHPDAAARFAQDPGRWLEALESGALIDAPDADHPRRVLVRRVYANPATIRHQRGAFTRAGFQIVDCPPLTGRGKNSADITMVMDLLDLLAHPTRFDEFIVLSGDSDFTPVLARLRAHDRRTVIFVNEVTASAYRSLADGFVDEDALLEVLLGPPRGSAREDDEPRLPFEPRAAERRPQGNGGGGGGGGGGRLPRLSERLYPLARAVNEATGVPLLAPEVYAALFRTLAAEIAENGFGSARTAEAVARRLDAEGMPVYAKSVGFVLKGLVLSGVDPRPGDTAGTLAKSFARQVVTLLSGRGDAPSREEVSAIGEWIIGGLRARDAASAPGGGETRSTAAIAAEFAEEVEEDVGGYDDEDDEDGDEPDAETAERTD